MFFEQAREQAEKEFTANNQDALVRWRFILTFAIIFDGYCILFQALTKWGGALLELAHFRQGHEAYSMIEDAVEKFQNALKIDEKRHDALWCLGNAYTSQGFLSASAEVSEGFFAKAGDCFQKAVDMEPNNESYKRALEMSAKAPQLYAELQKQLAAANAPGGGAAESSKTQSTGASQPLISDFWYDVAGWACLIGIGFGIAALSNRASTSSA